MSMISTLPVWLQMVTSGIVALGAFLIPESPRWLIANDKHDRAAQAPGDVDHHLWDYHELWHTHSAHRRLICIIGMACFGQISGNSLSSYCK
ncbi:hypothetical protein SODALDRAFT_364343 [Sodiomyces alkalinus F11]|uniref:Major facilitator superfamily (MFS) profile domain-containing protein n=1 Tax=Sodiomyces alkalinus (strain CBS 110278 / VKM F-3762 / F11) TaxID=1314773 RepID=A0A3N2PJ61_SODAK|nr:hypothetical protein SODALDRAFT_364343 [Sodiomyces alkalinus F11]ROT34577.1 hypothetical protein SODALDRAFT_364343 [Sodiomyces alkalinus F11]